MPRLNDMSNEPDNLAPVVPAPPSSPVLPITPSVPLPPQAGAPLDSTARTTMVSVSTTSPQNVGAFYHQRSGVPVRALITPVAPLVTKQVVQKINTISVVNSGGGGGSGGGGSTTVIAPFNEVGAGVNTGQNLIVGNGSVLDFSGTGIIDASKVNGIDYTVNLPTHAGQIPISQPGNTSVAYADPQVQGLYAAGSSIASPPVYVAPTTIQPVYVGGKTPTGTLAGINVDASGNLIVTVGTSGGSKIIVWDGTNQNTYKPASTLAALTDTSLVVQLNPIQPTSNMSGTIPGVAPGNTTIIGGIYNSSLPAPNPGQTLPLQLDANGNLQAVEYGTDNFGTNQVSVTSGGVTVVAARATRLAVIITNLGTIPVYLGKSGVSSTTGYLLPGVVGAFVVIPTTAAVYGIVTSTSQSVSFLEVYN